jgi:hypothetical protein
LGVTLLGDVTQLSGRAFTLAPQSQAITFEACAALVSQ